MAFIAKTMFEVTVSNSVRNQTQNVAGKFNTESTGVLTPADASAGILAVPYSLLPLEGYESIVDGSQNPKILNGNSWNFIAAANGTSGGKYGDHTGIYAFNNYDVNKAQSGANQWNVGANTLGLGLPAGNMGDFTEIIIGEHYSFGKGNFSTAPGAGVTTGYATISNGLLVFSADAPAAASGVYFELLYLAPLTEGTSYPGDKYVLKACRTAEAAAEG